MSLRPSDHTCSEPTESYRLRTAFQHNQNHQVTAKKDLVLKTESVFPEGARKSAFCVKVSQVILMRTEAWETPALRVRKAKISYPLGVL